MDPDLRHGPAVDRDGPSTSMVNSWTRTPLPSLPSSLRRGQGARCLDPFTSGLYGPLWGTKKEPTWSTVD